MVQDLALVGNWGKTPRVWVMDRFQLTVRRENCPAPMLPCAPVQSIEEGTGVISLGTVGDSGEGLEKRSIPGLRGALLPRNWCLISYQTSQWCPVQLFVRQLCRS